MRACIVVPSLPYVTIIRRWSTTITLLLKGNTLSWQLNTTAGQRASPTASCRLVNATVCCIKHSLMSQLFGKKWVIRPLGVVLAVLYYTTATAAAAWLWADDDVLANTRLPHFHHVWWVRTHTTSKMITDSLCDCNCLSLFHDDYWSYLRSNSSNTHMSYCNNNVRNYPHTRGALSQLHVRKGLSHEEIDT